MKSATIKNEGTIVLFSNCETTHPDDVAGRVEREQVRCPLAGDQVARTTGATSISCLAGGKLLESADREAYAEASHRSVTHVEGRPGCARPRARFVRGDVTRRFASGAGHASGRRSVPAAGPAPYRHPVYQGADAP